MRMRNPYRRRAVMKERIKRKIVELSRKYNVQLDGKPHYGLHVQQTIFAYSDV